MSLMITHVSTGTYTVCSVRPYSFRRIAQKGLPPTRDAWARGAL